MKGWKKTRLPIGVAISGCPAAFVEIVLAMVRRVVGQMGPSMNRPFFASSAFFLLAAVAAADNWPGWRGPHGDGRSAEKDLPAAWSDTENVKWKVNLPEKGHAAPVVWGNRVILAQPLDAKGKKRALWCLD